MCLKKSDVTIPEGEEESSSSDEEGEDDSGEDDSDSEDGDECDDGVADRIGDATSVVGATEAEETKTASRNKRVAEEIASVIEVGEEDPDVCLVKFSRLLFPTLSNSLERPP